MTRVRPIYDLGLLPPGKMEIDIAGSSIESGRSQSGITGAIDFSGGGLWTVRYSQIQVFGAPQHLYYQYLRNYLRGGVRSIVVPMLTDYVAPTPTPGGPIHIATPFSDGSSFSDGSLFRQSSIQAVIAGYCPLNATTISLKMIAGGALQGGETFAIDHPAKAWRAYGICEIDSVGAPDMNGAITYQVAIAPPLRQAVSDQTPLEFARPKCLMRLMAGGPGMPWAVERYWQGLFDISFIESFRAT
jgi:hypothetical protein